jgi:hypothetical protein
MTVYLCGESKWSSRRLPRLSELAPHGLHRRLVRIVQVAPHGVLHQPRRGADADVVQVDDAAVDRDSGGIGEIE